jgi:hypothetical protein
VPVAPDAGDGIAIDELTAVDGPAADEPLDLTVHVAASADGAAPDADADASTGDGADRDAPTSDTFDPSALVATRAREHFEREVTAAALPGSEGSSSTPSHDPGAPAPLPGAAADAGAARHHGSGSADAAAATGSAGASEALATAHDDVRGRLDATYAQLSVGDGDQRVDLAIHARGEHVHINATTANPELAAALRDGTGDLASALARHGLALGDMSASPDRGQRDAPGETPAVDSSHNASTPSKSASPSPAPRRPGVRVVA